MIELQVWRSTDWSTAFCIDLENGMVVYLESVNQKTEGARTVQVYKIHDEGFRRADAPESATFLGCSLHSCIYFAAPLLPMILRQLGFHLSLCVDTS